MRYLTSIILVFTYSFCSAQEIKKTQDLGLWAGFSIEYDLGEDFELSLLQDFRIHESVSELDKYISDIGIDYRINKRFKIGGNVRYFFNRKKDKTISENFRYNLDFHYKTKWYSDFRFKYRLRFQSNYEEPFGIVKEGVESNVRNEAVVQYRFDNHRIYFSSELFREITSFREPHWNQLRFFIGDHFETGIGEFELSAGYERELDSNNPLNLMIVKIRYSFELGREE